MKNIFVIFLLVMLLSGCGKEDVVSKEKQIDSNRVVEVVKVGGLRVNAASGLNLRKSPSLRSPILRLIPDQSSVKLLKVAKKEVIIAGKKGYWVLIEFRGLKGWVFDAFLRK